MYFTDALADPNWVGDVVGAMVGTLLGKLELAALGIELITELGLLESSLL